MCNNACPQKMENGEIQYYSSGATRECDFWTYTEPVFFLTQFQTEMSPKKGKYKFSTRFKQKKKNFFSLD